MFLYNSLSFVVEHTYNGSSRVLWSISDCFTNGTPLKRKIKFINRWCKKSELKLKVYNQNMNNLLAIEEDTLRMLKDSHNKKQDSKVVHYARSIRQLNRQYTTLRQLSDKLDITILTIKNAARDNIFALELKDATKLLKDINDYAQYEQVSEVCDEFKIETDRSDALRVKIDTSVNGMQTDEKIRSEQTHKTISEQDELLSIIQKATAPITVSTSNDNRSRDLHELAIEVVNTTIDNDLEARYKLLCQPVVFTEESDQQ